MNKLLNELVKDSNITLTENGSQTYRSTLNANLDFFALAGSYRSRSDNDCIFLFKKAYEEDAELAMKNLFHIRDCRGGYGERRFFRVVMKWLAVEHPEAVRRNIQYFSEYGRTDDLYCLIGTPCENDALEQIKIQLAQDVVALNTPNAAVSLTAKWCASINASSKETRALGEKTRNYLNLTHKQYRKLLTTLRARINLVETLMSENRWNEIDFSKIPSRAGLQYRKAFERHEEERYKAFMADKKTKVNADVLNPVDIADKILFKYVSEDKIPVFDKYWSNLKDYYNGREENAIAVVDVSGSMYGRPIAAAVSMGAYIAERNNGPFANYFITFSQQPKLVNFEGINIVDKFNRAIKAEWGYNTNLEAVMDLILNTAIENNLEQKDLPQRLYILSDMEWDEGLAIRESQRESLFEAISRKWKKYGYQIPKTVFWNLSARNDRIPVINGEFAYVSGSSMSTIEAILSGKDGLSLMLEVLNSDRYAVIH